MIYNYYDILKLFILHDFKFKKPCFQYFNIHFIIM